MLPQQWSRVRDPAGIDASQLLLQCCCHRLQASSYNLSKLCALTSSDALTTTSRLTLDPVKATCRGRKLLLLLQLALDLC